MELIDWMSLVFALLNFRSNIFLFTINNQRYDNFLSLSFSISMFLLLNEPIDTRKPHR